jgi:hypothetical protein
MRQGSVPSESGPQFAPHFNSCGIVGLTGETPVNTITTYTATFIPTNVVVMGCLLITIFQCSTPAFSLERLLRIAILNTNRTPEARKPQSPVVSTLAISPTVGFFVTCALVTRITEATTIALPARM